MKILYLMVLLGAILVMNKKKDQGNTLEPLRFVRENFIRLNPKFGMIPLYEGKSSFTENKRSITLCIRNAEGQFYDKNTIMYVALHELSHIVTDTYDVDTHGKEFRKNFEIILKKAAQLDMYNPRISVPESYCGVH